LIRINTGAPRPANVHFAISKNMSRFYGFDTVWLDVQRRYRGHWSKLDGYIIKGFLFLILCTCAHTQLVTRREKMASGMDPMLLLILVLIVSAIAWTYWQVQALNRRLTSLEKEYLALVEDLEERLYRPS
jgi:hypothetical protein